LDQPVIEARDLTKHYGPTVGLEGLDLAVERGEVFGFLGPNGAGKTTTIRLLLDLIRPTRGDARLFSRPTGDPEVRSRIGYLPGDLVLDGRLTGVESLRFLAALDPRGRSRPLARRGEEVAERLGLTGKDLDRRVREYSRGMRQKLGLAAALQHAPDLLILDEPTAGLDPLVREVVFELLQQAGREGRTVFHSSHVLSEVERTCTRVGILRAGRLVSVARTEEVRRASVRRMVVRFARPVPPGEFDIPGVEVMECQDTRVVLRVAAALDPLIQVLARHPVEHLAFPEPSLEEAFVELYREPVERLR
jgi:ABC-2 type transport system ATP-binding protein